MAGPRSGLGAQAEVERTCGVSSGAEGNRGPSIPQRPKGRQRGRPNKDSCSGLENCSDPEGLSHPFEHTGSPDLWPTYCAMGDCWSHRILVCPRSCGHTLKSPSTDRKRFHVCLKRLTATPADGGRAEPHLSCSSWPPLLLLGLTTGLPRAGGRGQLRGLLFPR